MTTSFINANGKVSQIFFFNQTKPITKLRGWNNYYTKNIRLKAITILMLLGGIYWNKRKQARITWLKSLQSKPIHCLTAKMKKIDEQIEKNKELGKKNKNTNLIKKLEDYCETLCNKMQDIFSDEQEKINNVYNNFINDDCKNS